MAHQKAYQFQLCLDDFWPATGVQLAFDPSVAGAIGINETIILRFIYDNTSKKQKSWLRASYTDWQKTMPWLSVKTITRAIKFLEDEQLIERHIDRKLGNSYRPIHANIAKLVTESHNKWEMSSHD